MATHALSHARPLSCNRSIIYSTVTKMSDDAGNASELQQSALIALVANQRKMVTIEAPDGPNLPQNGTTTSVR